MTVILLGLAALATRPARADGPCDEEEGLIAQPALVFIYDAEGPQRALIENFSDDRVGWVEVAYEQGALTFSNRLPLLGLPFSPLHISVDVIDLQGHRVDDLSMEYPSPGACGAFSVYPGSHSAPLSLPRVSTSAPENLRLRVRVWTK